MEVKLQLPNGKDYLSPSSAKQLYKHPLSYLAYINDKFTPNDEMIFGQYYEDFIYGVNNEDKFFIYDDEMVVKEAIRVRGKESANIRATNEYKAVKLEALDGSEGKHIITEEDHHRAVSMGVIMKESLIFEDYLNGDTQVEKSSIINTEEYIVKALVKSDVVFTDRKVVNDLKTTSSEISSWIHQAKKLHYDLQAYLSYEVWDAEDFNFIVQRTSGLYDIGVFNVAKGGWFYESGRLKFNKAVDNYLNYFSPEAKMMEVNPANYVLYQNI